MTKKKPPPSKRTDADRRVRQAEAIARRLKLLFLLLGRGRWNIKPLTEELADHLGLGRLSEQTIYRDLRVLKYAGVPIEFDRQRGCYSVRSDFKFPVVNLTQDELLGQATATAVASVSGLGIGKGAKLATQKIAAASTEEVEQLLADAQAVTVALDLKLADHSRHHEIIRTIQWALIRGRQVSGRYVSPYQEKAVKLLLHPYRLCLVRQAWYLIARPEGEADPRTYRVQRFKTLEPRESQAEVPEEFDLQKYFGNAWSVYRGAETFDVEIEFTKQAAPLVTETSWHSTQAVEHHRDGRVTLRFRVDGLEEILWWVLSWSGRAKVIRPEKLRLLVLDQLQAGVMLNS